MSINEFTIDAFTRIQEVVHHILDSVDETEVTYQPAPEANSIAWLVWHLSRIQDDHIAELASINQVWTTGWFEQFNLPFDQQATGYGHTSKDVAKVRVSPTLLRGYFDAVHQQTITYVAGLQPEDYDRIVDTTWNPPVSLGARLVSVIADDLQHAGQARYIQGLLPSHSD